MCCTRPRTYSWRVNVLEHLDSLVLFAIGIAVAPVAGYAFVHALRQRSDAFTAVAKLTKNAWLGITGAAAFFLLLIPAFSALSSVSYAGFWGVVYSFQGPGSSMTLFWLAGLVAVCVYIVDVKPAVVGVQGGGQRW
jgi:Protein of unknown function (DUF2516)